MLPPTSSDSGSYCTAALDSHTRDHKHRRLWLHQETKQNISHQRSHLFSCSEDASVQVRNRRHISEVQVVAEASPVVSDPAKDH